MPEKVRRIKDTESKSRIRRGIVFVLLVGALAASAWVLTKTGASWIPDQPHLTSREVVAALCQNSDCFSLNRDGVIFDRVPRVGGSLVLRITQQNPAILPRLGEQHVPPETLAEIIFLRDELRGKLGVIVTDAETSDPTYSEITLTTEAGWKILFHTDANAPASIEVLRRTLAELNGTPIEYIDLRIPDRVYYKAQSVDAVDED